MGKEVAEMGDSGRRGHHLSGTGGAALAASRSKKYAGKPRRLPPSRRIPATEATFPSRPQPVSQSPPAPPGSVIDRGSSSVASRSAGTSPCSSASSRTVLPCS